MLRAPSATLGRACVSLPPNMYFILLGRGEQLRYYELRSTLSLHFAGRTVSQPCTHGWLGSILVLQHIFGDLWEIALLSIVLE